MHAFIRGKPGARAGWPAFLTEYRGEAAQSALDAPLRLPARDRERRRIPAAKLHASISAWSSPRERNADML